MNEDQDVGAGVATPHPYVVEAAVVAQGELAVAVDAVVADAVGAVCSGVPVGVALGRAR